jgi:hypothetical protein
VWHVSLPSSYRSQRGHIHLPRVLPLVGCRSKTPINTNADRAVGHQQELVAAAPGAEQPPGNIAMQAPAAPAAPRPHQQHEPRRSYLHARNLPRDFEQDGDEVYNSPQADLGAALAALGQLEDTPAIQRLQAHICVATAQVEERGPGYS